MQFKKSKTFLAAILAGAMACSALVPTAASAAGSRTKAEKYGDSTYAERFMSLYDDVVTNGVENGYMSSSATVSGGFNVPYHSVEELCIEAPDYGHETTSEALSYLVWIAAMRDNIVNKGTVSAASGESVGDLAKAWTTMEAALVPDVQGNNSKNYMQYTDTPKATYSPESANIEDYPMSMQGDKTGLNPIHKYFVSAYGNQDKGLYLLHWLADVDNWYGYYNSSYTQTNVGGGKFTLINTFQRGASESCWETIPHASVETLTYGISGRGMKGFFNTETAPAQQWCYTNAPDAEDRAIQAVYAANRWGVGDQTINSKWNGSNASVSSLAGKMGDELRNDMYDKYYQKIGGGSSILNSWSNNADESLGKHYLMSWYTSWGGALDCSWAWQIGCSHSHEFYQNPLAAFALLADSDLNSAMTSTGATEDYTKSLERQMELYLWLLSSDGLIAGGCTNSIDGHYGTDTNNLPTFYGMYYQEHPVYADPGSNHWIGNQVWAVQRLAELYYVIKTSTDTNVQEVAANCNPGGMTLEAALEKILDRWVGWFVDNTILGTASETISWTESNYDGKSLDCEIPDISTVTDDGKSYAIPSTVNWSGQPNTWNGDGTVENSTLTAKICGYGSSDMGCVSSLANSLIYYAAANGVDATAATDADSYQSRTTGETDSSKLGASALYLAKELLDREWNANRDDIGLSAKETNGSLVRLWEQEVYVPNANSVNGDGVTLSSLGLSNWTGKMPNNDPIQSGIKFIDIRTQYEKSSMYQDVKSYYEANGNTDGWEFNLHRFWHAGDILMALGTMSEIYPTVTPSSDDEEADLVVTPTEITVKVGETEDITSNVTGSTFESADSSIATVDENGTVTGVAEGTTTVTVTTPGGQTATVTVTVTADGTTTTTTTTGVDSVMIGDVNLDGNVSLADLVVFQKFMRGAVEFNEQQSANADCDQSDSEGVTNSDVSALLKFLIGASNVLPITTA